MRRYALTNMMNMRDLGGYPISLTACTKFGRFIRSDAPLNLTGDELQMLKDMKVTTTVDLRSEAEVLREPSVFRNIEGVHYVHQPLNDGEYIQLTCEEDISKLYFRMTEAKDSMREIMKVFAQAENAVLFHCAAGKDRTGIIAAFLLSLAGVSMCDIIADYQVSHTYVRKLIDRIHDIQKIPAFIGLSKPEYMEKFFGLFLAKYESVEAYLLGIGVSDAEIQSIRARLID